MKIIFAGSPQIAANALKRLAKEHEVQLVITMPDSPLGRAKVLTPTPVAQVASELGLETLKLRKFDDSALERIRNANADLAVVLAFGALIPQTALDLLPWINLHFSLLPQWRGASPLQHSILHGTGAGFTLFALDAGMDTGPILHQEPVLFDENSTSGELLDELTDKGIEKLLTLLREPLSLMPQQGESSHAPKLSREAARVRFSNRAPEIHRMVMAFNPEPMAWCELNGSPFRLIRTRSLGDVNWNGLGQKDLLPGEVAEISGKVFVGCADGTRLELVEVQPSGKKAMPAADWFRGLSKEAILD